MRTILAAAGMAAMALLTAGCGGDTPQPAQMQTDPRLAYVDSRAALLQAAESPHGVIRCHAMEAMGATLGADAGGALLAGLGDKAEAVQFAAAMATGDARYEPARPRLLALLGDPATSPNVQAAGIYALHRLGDQTYTWKLGELLFLGRPASVRANAAMVMGRMEEPSAAIPLRRLLDSERDDRVRIAIWESLAALNDARALSVLTGSLRVASYDERMIAIAALGQARHRAAQSMLQILLQRDQDPRIRLQSAWALARMGDGQGYAACAAAARNPVAWVQQAFGQKIELTGQQAGEIQALAARALREFHQQAAVDVLVPLVRQGSPVVRLAAAQSVLALLAPSTSPAAPPEPVTAGVVRPEPEPAGGRGGSILNVAPPRD